MSEQLTEETSVEPEAASSAVLPESPEQWRALISAIPPREILRILQPDKVLSRQIFVGFRASAEALKNPIVIGRLVEAAQRRPALAQIFALFLPELEDETDSDVSSPEEIASTTDASATVVPAPVSLKEDTKLKEKVRELRSTIREKESRITELEGQLAGAIREREATRLELESEKKGRRELEGQLDRERRKQERELRRVAGKPEPEAVVAKSEAVAAAPTTVPTASSAAVPTAFQDAMRRLLNRGKHSVVADICREILTAEGLDASERGAVLAQLAASLYGQAQNSAGEEQDRLAVTAYLDAGIVGPAAESLARCLTHGPAAPLRPAEMALLQRLLVLANKSNQTDVVQAVFSRLRVTAPTAYQRLRLALQTGGKKVSGLLDSLAAPGSGAGVTADEVVALPTVSRTAASVTARRLVEAVDQGEENYITCARDGIEALRSTSAPLADALLEAVAALQTVAIHPLTNPLTRPIVVDASNVARYVLDPLAAFMSGAPAPAGVGQLVRMRDFLLKRGFFPVLMIADANLRHLVDDKALYASLVERGIVRETPGSSADGTLIAEARERMAPLVTNDRLAEWGDAAKRLERLAFDLYADGITLTPL